MDDDALVTVTLRKRHITWVAGIIFSIMTGSGSLSGYLSSESGKMEEATRIKQRHIHQVCTAAGYVDAFESSSEEGPPVIPSTLPRD